MKVLMILSKEILTDDRVYREAKALVDAGYEVAIIAWDRCGEYERKSEVDEISIFRIHNKGLMKILPQAEGLLDLYIEGCPIEPFEILGDYFLFPEYLKCYQSFCQISNW